MIYELRHGSKIVVTGTEKEILNIYKNDSWFLELSHLVAPKTNTNNIKTLEELTNILNLIYSLSKKHEKWNFNCIGSYYEIYRANRKLFY